MTSNTKKNMAYVRLGNSGLKVSRIILGLMSYGTPEWDEWVLGEEEGIKHIKAAYDAGIQTFDTANVYSNGLSEVILGKAIKQHKLPRDEIVIMTKVWGLVGRTPKERYSRSYGIDTGADAAGCQLVWFEPQAYIRIGETFPRTSATRLCRRPTVPSL
ncbi:hypothetical protein FS749_012885 [Ceratobasidium sp. UAMH 11750]|nr:hypothetical protein FS749_012885 [Ceratobasidium sp. UAMH 11750]